MAGEKKGTDSLAKSREVEDICCIFCTEAEPVQHVFFDCVVTKQCWCMIPGIVKVKVGDNLVA